MRARFSATTILTHWRMMKRIGTYWREANVMYKEIMRWGSEEMSKYLLKWLRVQVFLYESTRIHPRFKQIYM